ncbi:MAG: radical SAM protein [Chloroflexota bacterium]|nr:radical SAM protein [Chloroflexota bacterium]
MPVPDVMLISPPDYNTREFRGAQPLGIAYLASTLRTQGNVSCRLLDANVDGPTPIDQVTAEVIAFVEEVRSTGGHPVVGISTVSQVIKTVVVLADRIKAAFPDTLIILGGYHPTFAHREILRDFPSVDICVRGEGEQTLLEIMCHWQEVWQQNRAENDLSHIRWDHIAGVSWRDGEKIVANSSRPNARDLDLVPFPARDLLPGLASYPVYNDTVSGTVRLRVSLMSSRGCPFSCSFCSIITFYGDGGGKPWRGRSVENVVAEMIEVADTLGAGHFEFQDDNFFVRPERAQAIVEGYAATGRDFSFAFLTRADQIVRGESYFPALRDAGLRYVSVGIESGSEASLKRMVKETSVELNRKALKILHDNDVAAQVEFIMFEPGSALGDLQDNLQFLEEQGLFGYFPPLIFGGLLLFPGTPIRQKIARERGTTGSIHSNLPYSFQDGRVTQVFDLLRAFEMSMGPQWFDVSFALLDGIPTMEIELSANGESQSDAERLRALAEMKLEFFALTRIPYNLLRRGLAQVANEGSISQRELLDGSWRDQQEIMERVQQLQAFLPEVN